MKDRHDQQIISSVLVDDEPEAVRGMQETLALFCPEVRVVGTAGSVEEGLRCILEAKPQLVFLDIQMRDGLGFDLLERLPERRFAVIFVTAFDQYTVRALRMNAMDYLLKPVDPDELTAAVERVKTARDFPDYATLLESHAKGVYSKIGVPGPKGTIFIELQDILRLESSNNYTFIHLMAGKPLLIARTIKSFEETLPEDDFVRCHQRHIVNLLHVKQFVRAENSFFVLANDMEVPVSRANKTMIERIMRQRFPSV